MMVNENNVGRYCFDRMIGDRTWRGAADDVDVSNFIQQHQSDITITFETARSENEVIKYYFEMKVEFYRIGPEETDVQHTTARFYIPPMTSDLDELNLPDIISQFMEKIDGFSGQNSGWIVSEINYLRLCWGCYRPLMAGTYIPTPKSIALKKAIVNVKCVNDENCFQYSILAGMNILESGKNKNRPSRYKQYMYKLNMNGIQTPVPLSSIDKFEDMNVEISVNVLYFDNQDIIPIRTSKFCQKRKYHVNLLMLTNGDKFHYTYVQSLSRLVAKKTIHHKTYVCHYCLHPFNTEDNLNEHLPLCSQHESQQIVYPKPGKNILKFDKFHFRFPVPFAIYVNFESFLQKDDDQHVPSGFCVVTSSIFEEHDYVLYCYTGENVIDEFFAYMHREEQRIRSILSANEPMIDLTPEEEVKHNNATVCCLCNKKFRGSDRIKKIHHCHVTGKYLATICHLCNLQLKYRRSSSEHFFIPCFFHNSSAAYDSHMIIKHLHSRNAKITVIPNNTDEKFIGFQIDGIRYLHSIQFLQPSSLENLVLNLHNDDGIEPFRYTRRTFGDSDPDIFRKCVFPYEYMTDRDIFKETSLPTKESFYSKLKMECVTEEQYEHAQQMWNRYGCQTMENYTALHIKLDTVLFADVFEHFRRLAFQQYGLDPAHCRTLAGYTWQAALKLTGMQLELITDPDIFLMVESAIRGGISMVSNRLATANNKYLKSYDTSKPSSYIMSWDVVDLYQCCMLFQLPCGNFRFLKDPENFDFQAVQYDGDTGYILEVDMQYPYELHDRHSDLPLAPEHLKVTPDMLSDYGKTDSSFRVGQFALTPNLYDKTKYILYIENLQLYTQLGMKVQKIHRILAFEKKAYLAPYILFNNEKQQHARSDFEKDVYKLLSNAVYDKMIKQQLRSRTTVKLISDPNEAKRFIRKPTCKSFHIINDDLIMVHLGKQKIQMNKPIFVGMVIQEIAKLKVYDLHYNYILNKYSSEKAKLLFTDTDCITYSIETDDIYEDIKSDARHRFDCIEYAESPLRLGRWKDVNRETGPIRQFVGIRTKMYSIRCESKKKFNKVKSKGGIIKASYRQRNLRHRHYLRALLSNTKTRNAEFWQITRSSIHDLKTVIVCKKKKTSSLNPIDCKRFVLPNGIDTLAYGHYSLR